MDIKSIATTFAPCLMRSPEVKDMQVMMYVCLVNFPYLFLHLLTLFHVLLLKRANIQQEIKFMVNLLMLMNSAVIGEAPG